VLMRLLGRRGGGAPRQRALPNLDETLEALLATLVNVLVVEIFAARTFDWGERLLSDPEVSEQPERAGAMVSYIRSDESPHVEYLRTALSELRARTLRGVDGAAIPGREAVDRLLHRTLRVLTTPRPEEQRAEVRSALADTLRAARAPSGLLEEFDALDTPWTPPARTGFERASEREGAEGPGADPAAA